MPTLDFVYSRMIVIQRNQENKLYRNTPKYDMTACTIYTSVDKTFFTQNISSVSFGCHAVIWLSKKLILYEKYFIYLYHDFA